jgi:DsbC/DsbD-like thiol-disulfide interchange protein
MALLALAGAAAFVLVQADVPTTKAGAKGTSADKVKVMAKASAPDAAGKQTVTLTLDIDKGWHIYANPVGNEDLDGAKTIITITGKTKPQAVKVEYPPGMPRQDKIVGPHKVYEDRVTIQALVQRAQGDVGPLEVSIQVNACDKDKCLRPGQIRLTVP